KTERSLNIIRKLYIAIIVSRLSLDNRKGVYESEKKQLHTGIYETELKIEDFEDHLVRTILSNKGDGLDLNIYSTKNCTYIDIDLIIHDDETEPNIDYIINFLESFHSEKGHNKINDLKK